MSTSNFVIKDSNALQIWKGKEVVCEARSAAMAHRLAKLLNIGLQEERKAAEQRKLFKRSLSSFSSIDV